ncbi:hypothetical protein KUCAC02_019162, partial [Chaenocephalus aceratus]
SYVASVRTTIGTPRVLNFPVVIKKKKATIASCRLLFGETGDLRALPSARVIAAHMHP